MTDDAEHLTIEGIQQIFDASPYISSLELEALSVDYESGEFSARMPLKPSFERRAGSQQFHGGPIAAFIDIVGDFAIGMLVGGGVPTMNLRIDYLKPAVGEALLGVAKVRRRGRTVAIVDIDVTDSKGSLVAIGRGTYSPNRG